MFKLFRRIAREIALVRESEGCSLRLARAYFAEASRVERSYARYESPAYLRRRCLPKARLPMARLPNAC